MPDAEPPDAEPIPPPPPADPDSPERRELEAEPSTRCLNCGASLPGLFCPRCGQKDQPLRTPIHRFVVDVLAEYLGLDGRIWPTLGALLFRPGRLTQAYVRGQRERYVRPLRIYITASVLFFLVLSLADPLGSLRGFVGSGDVPPDSSLTAAEYLVHLDSLLAVEAAEDARQQAEVDSLARTVDRLQAQFEADSLAGVFAATPDSLEARLEEVERVESNLDDEQRDLRRMVGSTSDLRLQWRRDLVATYRQDSVIRPYDLVTASELVVDGGMDDPSGMQGPEWLTAGESAQRLKNARTNAQREDAAWALGRDVLGQVPKVIFLLLPVFALFLKVLYVRRGWYYAEHLVFALHTHAFMFSVFTVVALLIWATGGASWANILTLPLQFAIPVYFIVALKRVYAQGWIKTLLKVYLLGWMYSLTVLIAGTVLALLFAATMG